MERIEVAILKASGHREASKHLFNPGEGVAPLCLWLQNKITSAATITAHIGDDSIDIMAFESIELFSEEWSIRLENQTNAWNISLCSGVRARGSRENLEVLRREFDTVPIDSSR
jgi:hypothetical protein